MMLNAAIFREYDIRGIADTELQNAGIADLGRALGTLLQRRSRRQANRSPGRDCSAQFGPRLHNALLEGLVNDSGCEITDVGVVPTPLLYYSAVHLKTGGAIMITGSHNPAEFNGFKAAAARDSNLWGFTTFRRF